MQSGKIIKKITTVIFTCLFLWCIGFLWFLNMVPSKPTEDLRETDGIVVLTGGRDRLEVGLELLKSGYAPELFVSGVGKGVRLEELFKINDLSPEKQMMLRQRVSLGYAAGDTRENAIEVAQWASEKNLKRIRLVTSNYHIPRSAKEIKRRLPDVEIISYPVFSDNVKTRKWWQYPGTIRLLFLEYMKFIAVTFRVEI